MRKIYYLCSTLILACLMSFNANAASYFMGSDAQETFDSQSNNQSVQEPGDDNPGLKPNNNAGFYNDIFCRYSTNNIPGCSKAVACRTQENGENSYKCEECGSGWKLDKGGCTPLTCEATMFHDEKPSPCEEVKECPQHELSDDGLSYETTIKYGCEKCSDEYNVSEEALDPNAKYEPCTSFTSTKYKLIGCDTEKGYELYEGKCAPICNAKEHKVRNTEGQCVCDTEKGYEAWNGACLFACASGEKRTDEGVCQKDIPDHAVAFTMTTDGANKVVSLTTTGDATIAWGDGTTENVTGWQKITKHTYAKQGSYDVYVTGTPTHVGVVDGRRNYLTKLIDISLPSITSYSQSFRDAFKMEADLTNMTFPEGLVDATEMFWWDGKVTGQIPKLPKGLKNAGGMFYTTAVNGQLPKLPDTLEDASFMFGWCESIEGTIPETFPAGLRDMAYMFEGCVKLEGDISKIKLPENIEDTSQLFYYVYNLTGDVSNFKIPDSVTEASLMFTETGISGNIPKLPKGLKYASGMFDGCTNLNGDISDLELPDTLENATSMFCGCIGLTGSIPRLPDALEVGSYMFANCPGLTGSISELPNNLRNGAAMFATCADKPDGTLYSTYTFKDPFSEGMREGAILPNCEGLTGDISDFKFDKLVDGDFMFIGNSRLTGTIPALPSLHKGEYMFATCTGLTGQCPTKPSNLKTYYKMFGFTDITCDYGK